MTFFVSSSIVMEIARLQSLLAALTVQSLALVVRAAGATGPALAGTEIVMAFRPLHRRLPWPSSRIERDVLYSLRVLARQQGRRTTEVVADAVGEYLALRERRGAQLS